MPITLGGNIVPAGGQSFYLMEDIYLKGGLQIASTISDRDAIAITNLKLGQLVLCLDSNKIWQVSTLTLPTLDNPDVTPSAEWTEFKTGGGGGGTFTRSVVVYTLDNLAPGATASFPLTLGSSCIVFNLAVSRVVQVNAYGTPTMDEVNPYTFLATSDHLFDDGSTMLFDGTIIRSRNYSILANMENPKKDQIYFTITSVDDGTGPVALTLTYLSMELLDTTVLASGDLPASSDGSSDGSGSDSSGTGA